uniref:UvrB/UvrC protein n=1 Tax=uncultured Verrucomicrobiota bacterium TaxID=156588 RepID=D2DXX8_9BACT|nr:UvrB/UvrC protein [uncultured Verrucomicrobiota bacterium]
MSMDLNDLLRDWPHQPGQLQVRKITGRDGRQKIQLRIDMGLLQMEASGRPDGQRPDGAESLLELFQTRAGEIEASGETFVLSMEELGELQAEGIQYYHRYVAMYQLEDWRAVVRDTRRNLEMFNFVAKYAPNEEAAWSVQQFRPYVLMMHTRAKAYLALSKDDHDSAIAQVEKGIEKIERFLRDHQQPELAEENPEVTVLREWLTELRKKQAPSKPPVPVSSVPVSPLERLRGEMELAVKAEQYERAAELRDAIRALQAKR